MVFVMNTKGKISSIATLLLSAQAAYAKNIVIKDVSGRATKDLKNQSTSEGEVLIASQIGSMLVNTYDPSVPVQN